MSLTNEYMRKNSRVINNKELADLPSHWGNAKVDTSKYYQCASKVWEVNKKTFEYWRKEGSLCQIYNNKYYIGY